MTWCLQRRSLLPGKAARRHFHLEMAQKKATKARTEPFNVIGTARESGKTQTKVFDRKMRDTAESCRVQGLQFFPLAIETLGGFHSAAKVDRSASKEEL